jgi:hypothetical protein
MAGSSVRRLPPRWRKLLLTLHVAGSVALLGADGSVLLLGADAALGADPRDQYPAAALVGSALLVPLALVALVTGTALALLTPWGLFRHWWVTLKLVLTLAGTVLAFVVLTPTLDALAEAARAGAVIAATDRWVLVRDWRPPSSCSRRSCSRSSSRSAGCAGDVGGAPRPRHARASRHCPWPDWWRSGHPLEQHPGEVQRCVVRRVGCRRAEDAGQRPGDGGGEGHDPHRRALPRLGHVLGAAVGLVGDHLRPGGQHPRQPPVARRRARRQLLQPPGRLQQQDRVPFHPSPPRRRQV